MLRGERRHVGPPDPQGIGVLVVFPDEARGEVGDLDALGMGALDHLVVDVREVLDEGDLIPQMLQVAAQDVEDDERARVADVKEVVDRRAAAVEGDASRGQGDERLLFARQVVIKRQTHGNAPPD